MGSDPPDTFRHCDMCPVASVSWDDIRVFLARLNALDPNKDYRLPTEAEWEYALLAGENGWNREPKSLAKRGWFGENAGGTTQPVARLRPNKWGLYDMDGNVIEWVQDWYGSRYSYDRGPVSNPAGPESGGQRVVRGGSYLDPFFLYEWPSASMALEPSARLSNVGFRMARRQ